MNYIVLNNNDFFKDINIKGFKEVENENDRVDAVFGEITIPILEELYNFPERRDEILPGSWLLGDGGVQFILCKFDKGILHEETGKAIKKLLELYNKENFYIEIRSYHDGESYNQIECYVFAYNKSFEFLQATMPDKIEKDQDVLKTLCENIEKNLYQEA